MRKTDKKIDNTIRIILTQVCEAAKEQVAGFMWVTHQVNFAKMPDSLMISFIFESQSLLDRAIRSGETARIQTLTQKLLQAEGISLNKVNKQCRFHVAPAK
ncbi:Fis family transcriptional regulator [Shewanella sp. 30m-9]